MKIDKEKLELLEELAGLKVPADERDKIVEDLGAILGYVEQLKELDLPQKDFVREVVAGDDYRADEVAAATPEEQKAVMDNFPVKSDDGLLEAHAVLAHKQ